MESKQQEQNALQQLLGNPPSWTLRWGVWVVLLGTVGVVLLAWFVQYSDTISARVYLHTDAPVVAVRMPQTGIIDSVLVRRDSFVAKNTVLAVLQSTADYKMVQALDLFLKKKNVETAPIPALLQNSSVGSIAPFWNKVLAIEKEYRYIRSLHHPVQKKANIQEQIVKLHNLENAFLQQKKTLQTALELAQAAKERDELLLQDNALSAVELEQSQTNYLSAKHSLEAHTQKIITNQLEIARLRTTILDLEAKQTNVLAELARQKLAALYATQNALRTWKQQYLLMAPLAGKLHFTDDWIAGQQLEAQTTIMHLVPPHNTDKIIATALASDHRLGKIKHGTTARIRLDAYPYQEYGMLKGQVTHIPPVAQSDVFHVKITLPTPLTTMYGVEIPFRPNMKGSADLVTEKRRLLERFLDKIRSAAHYTN